jgi:hypothetical protein
MSASEAKELEPMDPFGAAVRVAKLELLRVSRGRGIRAAGGISLLLVLAAILGCVLGDGDSGATFNGTVRTLFPFLAIAMSLIFATRAMSEDVETATVHYLLMLPMPRWSVVLGKYLCAALVTTVLMVVSTALLYLGTHLAEPSMFAEHLDDFGRALGGMALASVCYTAIFLLLGAAVSDLPYLLPLLYVFLFEVAAGSVSFIELFAVRYHAGVIMGVPHDPGLLGTPDTPWWVAVIVISALAVVGLGVAAVIAESSEYRTGRA